MLYASLLEDYSLVKKVLRALKFCHSYNILVAIKTQNRRKRKGVADLMCESIEVMKKSKSLVADIVCTAVEVEPYFFYLLHA